MAHSLGEVVEVLDASNGWLPARVLRRHEDGAYDVSVNLDETIHLGDAAACLSLLCAGSQEAKIRSALGFYLDATKTSLTLPALRAYLTSIFKVVFEARNYNDQDQARKPSPRSTGDATARRCFEDHGLEEDEAVHVDDFVQWYVDTLSGNEPQRDEEEEESEEEEEAWTAERVVKAAFQPTDAEQAFAYLAQYRDARNRVSRDAFYEAVCGMLEVDPSPSLEQATAQLFDAFDADGNATIDFAELGAGLSVICGGDAEQRVRLAFSLFDLDGDGTISPREMTRYLTAVFRVAFARDATLRSRVAATPSELADATAQQAFALCDTNNDGKLDYREFRRWYLEQGGLGDEAPQAEDAIAALSNRLRGLDPRQVFRQLGAYANAEGRLTRARFARAFGGLSGDAPARDAQDVLDAAFDLFDDDHDGTVDGAELAAGLGSLCGGRHDVKVRLCFDLFDSDNDGYLDEWEVRRYLQSVYRTAPTQDLLDEDGERVRPEDLAAATAATIIREADADGDGRVSFNEFSRWVASDTVVSEEETESETETESESDETTEEAITTEALYGEETASEDDDATDAAASLDRPSQWYRPVDPTPPPNAAAAVHELREARALLNLDHFSLDELVEVIVEAAPRGGLGAEAFAKVCRRLATLGGNARGDQQTRADAARLSRRIFAAFDAQETDDVDFVEVAAGLAVLAPASMDDKIEAAFALYDVTRGGVAFEELRGYLLAVYRVLRACSASLALRIHHAGGPLKLADDTAAACFRAKRLAEDAPLDVQLFKEFVCEGISAAYEP